MKYTEDKSGVRKGESLPCPQKDGTEEYSTGILDWTITSKQEDKPQDPNEDGKTTSTNL